MSGGQGTNGVIGSAISFIYANIDDIIITGNKIGTDASGTYAIPNRQDAAIGTHGNSYSNVRIGGPGSERNIISGNQGSGISFDPTSNLTLQNNYIGVNANGDVLSNQGTGVSISLSGTSVIRDNLISGNQGDGLRISPAGTGTADISILNNKIGSKPVPDEVIDSTYGNRDTGIRVSSYGAESSTNANVLIGALGDGKIILSNGENGISASGSVNSPGWISYDIGYNILDSDPNAQDTSIHDRGIFMGGGNYGNYNQAIHDNVVRHVKYNGIWAVCNLLYQSYRLDFSDNQVTDSGAGIYANGCVGDFIGNIISNNAGIGVQLSLKDSVVADNVVNGNSGDGVILTMLENPGQSLVTGNVIQENNGNGISVYAPGNPATNTGIPAVTITENESSNNLSAGIALNYDYSAYNNVLYGNGGLGIQTLNGLQVNDLGDENFSTSGLLNYPIVRDSTVDGANTIITYDVDLQAGDYRFDVCYNPSGQDPSGYGECEQVIASQDQDSITTGKHRYSVNVVGTNFYPAKMSMQTIIKDNSDDGYGATSQLGNFQAVAADLDVGVSLGNMPTGESFSEDAGTLISVCNNGPESIESFVLDIVSAGFSITGYSSSIGSYNSLTGQWTGVMNQGECVDIALGGVTDTSGVPELTASVEASNLLGGAVNNDPYLDDNSGYIIANVPSDQQLITTLNQPGLVMGQATSYTFTYKNLGPASGPNSASLYLVVPYSLSLQVTEGLNYSCTEFGDTVDFQNSNPFFAYHPGNLLGCVFFDETRYDQKILVPVGDSFSFTLDMSVDGQVDDNTTLYALAFSENDDNNVDPDIESIMIAAENGEDIFTLPINNIANYTGTNPGSSDSQQTNSDSDPIPDSVEDAAPGNGDGNNDGTPDSQQSNVTSLPNASGDYITLAVPEGVTIDATTISQASTLSSKDIAYNYPLGLVSFTATTDIGATIPIELYFYTTEKASTFTPRKYNTTNQTYTTLNTLTQTSLTQITINNQPVLKLAYQLKDGGPLDQDNTANGTIVDPVGLAAASVGVPDTGL